MEFKGTKGDWKMSEVNISDYQSICVFSDGEEQKVLLHIHLHNDEITEEELSNAKLIAAAPDLLEALQGMMFIFEGLTDKLPTKYNEFECYKTAQKAIEKALL